jgi:hypothetical protein
MPLLGSRGAASLTGFGGLAKLGYLLRNSLRFRASNSNYLSRTFGTPTNNRVWTWSAWIKRGSLSLADADHLFFGSPTNVDANPSSYARLVFETDGTLRLQSASSASEGFTSSAVFRDPAAWYHIVLYMDAVNTTVRCYVNGTEIAYASRSNPTNTNTAINGSGNHHRMGFFRNAEPRPMDGYMAEVNFVDGQALTPSSFGKTDPATGQWIPIKYSGTYGTNGFYLPFSNTTSTSTLGNDFSGNSNTWTVNNFSLTAGATYDSMTDVPTLTNATTANYATLNPLLYAPSYGYRNLTNGNLTTIGTSGTNNGNDYSTQTMKTGMWYAEFTCTVGTTSTYPQVGIISVASAGTGTGQVGYVANSVAYFADGTKQINSSQTSYGNSYTTNDVIGVAVDADNGAIYFGKQTGGTGTIVWQNSGVPTSGASKTGAAWTWTGGSIEFYFSTAVYTTSNGWHANFGQRPFSSTPPSGFKALNTFNLP